MEVGGAFAGRSRSQWTADWRAQQREELRLEHNKTARAKKRHVIAPFDEARLAGLAPETRVSALNTMKVVCEVCEATCPYKGFKQGRRDGGSFQTDKCPGAPPKLPEPKPPKPFVAVTGKAKTLQDTQKANREEERVEHNKKQQQQKGVKSR